MIKIDNLTYSYDKKRDVLKNINLKIENGVTGLLGKNGAGKSTLLKLMSTLLRIENGQIFVDDISVSPKNYNKIRKILGFMPQEFDFYGGFTVYEMLEYLALLQKMKKIEYDPIINEYLEIMNLKDNKNKKTKQLSGGMKRRLGMISAILLHPKVLILDEPTAGLDPEERIKIRNYIRKYAIDKTVLLSTHIVEDIESICDNVAILIEGELKYHGPVKAYIQKSPNAYELLCNEGEIEELKHKGIITNILYQGEAKCKVTIVSEIELENAVQIQKTLETAYMFDQNSHLRGVNYV